MGALFFCIYRLPIRIESSRFSRSHVDGDYARNRARNGESDKVDPTELHVLESRECGEYQESEQHVQQAGNRAFEQSVLRVFETYKHPEKHRQDFDCDVDGQNDVVWHGRKSDDDCEYQNEAERYERCKEHGFQDVRHVDFDVSCFFHTKNYAFCARYMLSERKNMVFSD